MKNKDKKFSFKDAVKEAIKQFSIAKDNFLFMDVNDLYEDGSPVEYGHKTAKIKHFLINTESRCEPIIKLSLERGNSYACRNPEYSERFMIYNKKKVFLEQYPEQDKYFTFDHELAHLLTSFEPEEAPTGSPINECIADAYAAIRSIQRFGVDNTILQNKIWFRSYEGIHYGNWGYFTTPVLERILEDSKHKDFSKLSPAETLLQATAYSKVYASSVDELEIPQKHFKHLSGLMRKLDPTHLHQLENLSRTTLSSPDNFTFRIGVRAFQPFLAPEGVNFNDQHIQLSRPIRETHILKLSDEARKRGMDDLVAELKEEQSCFLPIAKKAKKVESKSAPAPFSIKY